MSFFSGAPAPSSGSEAVEARRSPLRDALRDAVRKPLHGALSGARLHSFGAGLRHAHDMPFGPRRIDPADPRSGYEFRLWAPSARHVELRLLQASGRELTVPCARVPADAPTPSSAPMNGHTEAAQPPGSGWHIARVPQARAGDYYGFRIGRLDVPDPASRFNPGGVHAPSQILDPRSFDWREDWAGRPWHEAVIYELHVGTFTPDGTYKAAEHRLDYLAGLGVTAIELMPLASAAGRRGWGYDGTLLFAPNAAYGHPNDLKHFIRAAHRRGLTVLLDVVYNHFGPDGNYLHAYGGEFFTSAHKTPWGDAMNFDGEHARLVREFFIHNALYWIDEYRFDGLRLDAAHAIFDDSSMHVLHELSARVRACAQAQGRHVHLILENANNEARHLGPPGQPGRYDAQWNDDFHHAAHVLLTGEARGYYRDFADDPLRHLMRCLTEGYAFQGEHALHEGGPRGERSAHLAASCFVNFLQNHDQIGNRGWGERLTRLTDPLRLKALAAIQLLAPGVPMLFMGEEFGATTPFLYFCDFEGELADAVREGRKREHGMTHAGDDGRGDTANGVPTGAQAADVPDPCDPATFVASKLDWHQPGTPAHREWMDFYARLLALRQRILAPRLARVRPGPHPSLRLGGRAFEVRWRIAPDGGAAHAQGEHGDEVLVLRANLGDAPSAEFAPLGGEMLAEIGEPGPTTWSLGAWAVQLHLLPPSPGGSRAPQGAGGAAADGHGRTR